MDNKQCHSPPPLPPTEKKASISSFFSRKNPSFSSGEERGSLACLPACFCCHSYYPPQPLSHWSWEKGEGIYKRRRRRTRHHVLSRKKGEKGKEEESPPPLLLLAQCAATPPPSPFFFLLFPLWVETNGGGGKEPLAITQKSGLSKRRRRGGRPTSTEIRFGGHQPRSG